MEVVITLAVGPSVQRFSLSRLTTNWKQYWLVLLFLVTCTISTASPVGNQLVQTVDPQQFNYQPDPPRTIDDCDNLLAFRLSLQEGSQNAPLENCSEITFTQSPPIAAFDCSGFTANECAAQYRTNLPQSYMSGGWNNSNELWYLPLATDVAGGNLCLDGTRQFVYVDKAVAWQCSDTGSTCSTNSDCANELCEAVDVESNDWVFYTQGGNNCLTEQSCMDAYRVGEVTTSTRAAPFGYNGEGLLSDNSDNPFHGHNRVRLRKCNRDGFTGNTTRPAVPGEDRPTARWENHVVSTDMYFHGYRQWLAAFEALENGYANHREFYGTCAIDSDCDSGEQCVTEVGDSNVFMCAQTKPLPPLSAANTILLSGWSGGATALSHTGDSLVEFLQTGAQPLAPSSDVHLAFDAAWKPGLQSDTAFSLGHRNMYLVDNNDIPTADMPGQLPDDADATVENGYDAGFSNETYVRGGSNFESHELWGIQFDESCVAMHGWDSWHCHERHHVLANHVTAPSFTRMAQRDGVGLDKPSSSHMHSVAPCKQFDDELNCYDWVDEEHRQRAFQQSVDFYRDHNALAEEGAGTPARGVFSPDNTKHGGFEDANQFLEVTLKQCRVDGSELRSVTLGEALSGWIDSDVRVGAIEFREATRNGLGTVWVNSATCSTCPQLQGAQPFALDNDLSEWDFSVCNF